MRLKKVMAIVLAAGLTVGSIALAAGADGTREAASSSSVPAAPSPGIIPPTNATAAPATDAPATDAPATDAPADPTAAPADPTAAPADPTAAPADPTAKPAEPTAKPAVKKPAKVALTKKAVKASGKKITVTVNKVSGAAGYQVTYATKKTFKGSKNVNVAKFSAKTKNVTIKSLKKGTYYVKVRAYKKSGSKKVYGAYSKVISVKIK